MTRQLNKWSYIFANGKDQSLTCEKKVLEHMLCLYTYVWVNKIIDNCHKHKKSQSTLRIWCAYWKKKSFYSLISYFYTIIWSPDFFILLHKNWSMYLCVYLFVIQWEQASFLLLLFTQHQKKSFISLHNVWLTSIIC